MRDASGIPAEIPAVEALFAPLPVVVESAWLPDRAPIIDPAEASQVERAVFSRRVEFATGRSCARRAFSRLGLQSFVLRNDADRAPRWPAGFVGSITHTGPVPGGYCGVAVASAAEVRAIGFDAEAGPAGTGEQTGRDGSPLPEELWSSILTPSEARWLSGREPPERADWVKVIFSAKECFYKAQFPLSGMFLNFADVETRVDTEASTFEARIVAPAPGHPLRHCRGRFLRARDLIVTGIAISA